MGLVAFVSWRQTRGRVDTGAGYFLAGRGLGATFIAGSLLLTNLSAEQLIGLNGSAYGYNLSSMGWEVTAAVATVLMAFFFLPKYLAGAFTTLPEFLSARFDEGVRRMTVVLFAMHERSGALVAMIGMVEEVKALVAEFLDIQTGADLRRLRGITPALQAIAVNADDDYPDYPDYPHKVSQRVPFGPSLTRAQESSDDVSLTNSLKLVTAALRLIGTLNI